MPSVSYSEDKKEYMRQWRIENPDKRRAAWKRYYERHKEACDSRIREWKQKNREKVVNAWYKYNETHREKRLAVIRRCQKARRIRKGKAYANAQQKKLVEKVTVGYARSLLCQRSVLRANDIPLSLAMAKQAEIKLRRETHGKA